MIKRNAARQMLHEDLPFWSRANQGHFAAQDVDDLWQLVKMRGPHQATNAGDAVVSLSGPDGVAYFFGVGTHGAELENIERLATIADTLLLIKDGAGRVQINA